MSEFMLNDEAAIDDINPFVQHDFSLPGGVRQTGNFQDFEEITPGKGIFESTKSVFCDTGLCEDERQPCQMDKTLHPRRNIDYGLGCGKPKKVKVGVSNKKTPWKWILIAVIIALILLILVR